MKLRVWHAYASNNSGAYTLVGTFREASAADGVARLLEEISSRQEAWARLASAGNPVGEEPLIAFARENELSYHPSDRDEDWPQHGPPPSILAAGNILLVHCAYTLSLPAMFGELIYRKGGRVETELEHTHHPLVARFQFWKYPETKESNERLNALANEIDARCEDRAPAAGGEPFARGRLWLDARESVREVAIVFADVVTGVAFVREACVRHDLNFNLRLSEAEDEDEPFVPFLLRRSPRGYWRVALWAMGTDRIRTMREVRAIQSCSPEAARNLVADLPRELLRDVTETEARAAAARLCAIGADAEAIFVRPER